MVPAVPPFQKYVHMGSEVLIDGLGNSGTIIINPSFVEKQLIQKTKSSVLGHLLGSYKNGLDNIKEVSKDELLCSASKDKDKSHEVTNMTDNIVVANDDSKILRKLEKINSMKIEAASVDVAKSAFQLQRDVRNSFYHRMSAIKEDDVEN